jgi:succinyl-CoA synthetase beta subunit
MKLLEHKGKELLEKSGIKISPFILVNNKNYINLSYHKAKYKNFFFEHQDIIIKSQIIATSRRKKGLIIEPIDFKESLTQIDNLYKQNINTLLIEKKLQIANEYFLAITYDTNKRQPMVIFSKQGGIDIEQNAQPHTLHFSQLEGAYEFELRDLAKRAGFTKRKTFQITRLIKKAINAFTQYDCTSLEINPIIETPEGILYAGDAKITIDDSAIARQEIFNDITDTEDQSFLNEREREARKIDLHDHRGVAGKTYIDLEGDIAVLASGGGASLSAMDALIEAGGKPANYTEYSGNPSKEKVQKITQLTLNKPNLKGCFVVGGRANFTDIYETLLGFMQGLKMVTPKPDYPIVIRRAGPRDKEAFEMVRLLAINNNFNITLLGEETSMSKAATIMVEKTKWA